MTIPSVLEALKVSVNYPLNDKDVIPLLIARGCPVEEDFTKEIAESKEYRLAYADVIRRVVTMVNLSQGGSVTAQSIPALVGTANAIYRKYGEELIGETADRISTLTEVSLDW